MTPVVIGLISDTHGLVRPAVHTALAGVSVILHAGDVGGHDVLDELALIAPVHAVFGNTDPPDDPRLRAELVWQAGDLRIHVSHGHELGSPTPAALARRHAEDVLVYGHTHQAHVERVKGRLVVNPGAAGPARFRLAPSVARLTIGADGPTVQIVPLE
jgi:putative phosphoesterase